MIGKKFKGHSTREEKMIQMILQKTSVFFKAIELFITIYTILIALLNLLNIFEFISFTAWFMSPNFIGNSLLFSLILQYCIYGANQENPAFTTIRPYLTGLLVATILSVCSLPLFLILTWTLGYILYIGFFDKYSPREMSLTLFITCASLEIYSIAMLFQKKSSEIILEHFFRSPWLDFLFLVVTVLYCVLLPKFDNKENKSKRTKTDRFPWITKWNECIRSNYKKIIHVIGGSISLLSLGVLLYFGITIVGGTIYIANTHEDIYLLRNLENPSLVLTIAPKSDENNYTVFFRKYDGSNDQKVYFRHVSENVFQLNYLEPECALTAKMTPDSSMMALVATPKTDSLSQNWHREQINEDDHSLYRWRPLAYDILSKEESLPAITLDVSGSGYQMFTLKKTVANESLTFTLQRYKDIFMPRGLMEYLIFWFGLYSVLIFFLLVLVFAVGTYLCKLIDKKLIILYTSAFAYLLAYGSVDSTIVFILIFCIQCLSCHCHKKRIQTF